MGGLLGGKPSAPEKPTVIPVSDDEAKKKAKRRRLSIQNTPAGRMATSNSPLDTVLGGG